MIMAKGGSANLDTFNHVGVQVDPDEHTLADAERAKDYLQRYFVNAKIDIYWGSAADFLRELNKTLKKENRRSHRNRRHRFRPGGSGRR
jgi:hypothetical protein